jgi:hypothetical protein
MMNAIPVKMKALIKNGKLRLKGIGPHTMARYSS